MYPLPGQKPRPPFRRSRNRIIAGVCAGCSEWLRWSPLVGRSFFATVTLLSIFVPGILVYLILWIIMPAPAADEGAGD